MDADIAGPGGGGGGDGGEAGGNWGLKVGDRLEVWTADVVNGAEAAGGRGGGGGVGGGWVSATIVERDEKSVKVLFTDTKDETEWILCDGGASTARVRLPGVCPPWGQQQGRARLYSEPSPGCEEERYEK